MRLRREGSRYVRVGHRGAGALAPHNSLAALELALAHGVDLIEFDVVVVGDQVLLAHSLRELAAGAPTLEAALDFLVERAPPDVGLVIEIKSPGREEAIVAAVREHGVLERTLVASFLAPTLRAVRRLEPNLVTGLCYPYDRFALSQRRFPAPVVSDALAAARRSLPRRIGALAARTGAGVALVHHLALSRAAVERCRTIGTPVLAWTIDDTRSLHRALALGVDGVVSNDPRLFDRAA